MTEAEWRAAADPMPMLAFLDGKASEEKLNLFYISVSERDAFRKPEQAALLREAFGPTHFRPVAVEPEWLTSTVVALAEGIRADRAFYRLPILADALQDAGCDNADILDHCRSDGPHVRGCWVVDAVLGKE